MRTLNLDKKTHGFDNIVVHILKSESSLFGREIINLNFKCVLEGKNGRMNQNG
jgi:hypothetical protein